MKVVVLGAGYAGVTAVMRLVRSKFPGEVVLVNDGPHHQLTTQMHRVAAGAVEPAAVLLSIDTLLRWTPARLVQGKATAIDPERRLVQLEDGRELDYDRLVVALGSRIETFGVPGVLEHALTVQPVQEALRTRRHLTARLHDAAFWDGELQRTRLSFPHHLEHPTNLLRWRAVHRRPRDVGLVAMHRGAGVDQYDIALTKRQRVVRAVRIRRRLADQRQHPPATETESLERRTNVPTQLPLRHPLTQ